MTTADPSWRQLLRELAEADAPSVIDEARAGARARARSALEDALVDELLRTVAHRESAPAREGAAPAPRAPQPKPDPEPKPGTEPAPASSTPDAGHAWWVYCVVPAAGAVELASGLVGVEPESAVVVLIDGDLAALVSRIPLSEYGDEQLREHLEDITWLERTARAHEAAQEDVMRQGPLVPLRLCTIYRDLDGVRRVLHDRSELFAENLAAVEDCAEWGIKVFLDLGAVARDSEPADPAPEPEARSSSGTEYLTSRQRERDQVREADQLCARCAQEVHEAVTALARQERANPVQRPEAHGREAEMILNESCLVEHSQIEDLQRLVQELFERWAPHGLLVELTGPWPPYNFVSDSAGLIS